MIAFFDSLVQRELEGWSSDSSGNEAAGPMIVEYDQGERESRATMEEEVEAESLSRVVVTTPEQSSDDEDRVAFVQRELESTVSADEPSTSHASSSRQQKKTISELIASRRSDYLKFSNKVTKDEKLARLKGKLVKDKLVNAESCRPDEDADDEDDNGGSFTEKISSRSRKRRKPPSAKMRKSIPAKRPLKEDAARPSSSSSPSSTSSSSSSSSSSSGSSRSSSSSSSSSSSESSSSKSSGKNKKSKLKDLLGSLTSTPKEEDNAKSKDSEFRSRPSNRGQRNYRKKDKSDEDEGVA